MLEVTHSAGFFSCCTVRLLKIVEFFNARRRLPIRVDSSRQFEIYKIDKSQDLTPRFFQERDDVEIKYAKDIHLTPSHAEDNPDVQFSDYRRLHFEDVEPFVHRYFSLANEIKEKVEALKSGYDIVCDRTCAVRYRGNDKTLETRQPPYRAFIEKARQIASSDADIKFLVQSDEREFIDIFQRHFPTSIVFREIPAFPKSRNPAYRMVPTAQILEITQYYVAAVFIISQCRRMITTSGNGELWAMLFRGHAGGSHQYLSPKKHIYGVRNPSYRLWKTNFWL
jgi:hypothetical protein